MGMTAANDSGGVTIDHRSPSGTVGRVSDGREPKAENGRAQSQVADLRLVSNGQPLSKSVREFFEPRFGESFDHVRVHADDRAAATAHSLEALAYTVGPDVVFARGEYQPETPAGKRLLAHELAHVVQQRGGARGVQRKFSKHCTEHETSVITQAASRAQTDLAAVLNLIKVRPLTQAVKDALWLAFRDESISTADEVGQKLDLLKNGLSGADYTCVNASHPHYPRKCEGQITYGYVQAESQDSVDTYFGPIYFCIPNFTNMADFNQSRGVIHEAAHRYLGVDDTGYFGSQQDLNLPNCQETPHPAGTGYAQDDKSGTEGDNPGIRLFNADAYACFVHFLVHAKAPDVTRQARQYRGGDLSIKVVTRGVQGNIYTETQTPTEPSFRIDNVPENSGFRFRWRFLVGSNRFNPLSTRGSYTGAYDEGNLEVFVGPGARSTLAGSTETKGKIVCEVKLFSPYGDITDPPDVIVEKEVGIMQGRDPDDPRIIFTS